MTSFGKYQVVELIGQGGFGRVYKAWDPALKRHVAVKTCTLQDEEMRARFGREAEIAANLRHPHIVTVYDYGHEDGEPYLVQEYLEGEDLDHKLKRRESIAPARLVEWLRQTAEGLEYAHRHGVLHRDVKPANIRVLPAGDVRIMDFGIAKLLEEDRQLTRTGMSVGTAGYLAPEQLMGVHVDHRADVFSFGAMAYELLAGQRPFEADSFTAILFRIAHEEPTPLPLVAPGADPRLVALVDRCLRKKPEERFSGFGEVIAALREIAAGPAPGTTPPPGTSDTIVFTGDVAATVAAARGASPSLPLPAGGEAGRPPETAPAAASGTAGGVAAPVDERPARRLSPAAWGLVGATVLVAGFGVLNVSRLGDSRTPDPSAATILAPGTEDAASSQAELAPPATASPVPVAQEPAAGTGPVAGAGRAAVPGASQSVATPEAGQPAGLEAGAPRSTAGAPSARRIVVLVAGTTRELADAAEATIIAELQEAGFDVRDAELVSGADASRAAAAQVSTLLGVGTAAGAATVFVADVSADARAIVAGMYSGTAAVTVKVYGTETGALIASERFEVGSAQSRAETGPTPASAAAAAVRAAAFQAARSTVRRLDAGRR